MTEPPFRFSKFYLRTLFDGQLHLVKRGERFPAHWSERELSKKLRAAALWRGTTVHLSHCPEGVWVQSKDNRAPELALQRQLGKALEENSRLKEELMELRREVWQLKRQ